MDLNTQTALIGAGISTGLYTLLKTAKYYYKHYYLKSECHNSRELVISIEPKEQPKEEEEKEEKEEKPKLEIELSKI